MKFTDPFYLASQSPQRKNLLTQVGLNFMTIASDIDETAKDNEAPKHYVERIAHEKAKAGFVHSDRVENYPVLAADTVIVFNDQIFGKPKNADDAMHMLLSLSGNTHHVMTAVALLGESSLITAITDTAVTFRELSQSEIECYVATGDPLNKSGSYAIQTIGATFVAEINGSYSGVIGLPIKETLALLSNHG